MHGTALKVSVPVVEGWRCLAAPQLLHTLFLLVISSALYRFTVLLPFNVPRWSFFYLHKDSREHNIKLHPASATRFVARVTS